jgi:hypothetical protein
MTNGAIISNYPRNIVWYVKASSEDEKSTAEGSAVAIRLRRIGEPAAKTYLLTCQHVLRGKSSDGHVNVGPLLNKIRVWAPDDGHTEYRARWASVDQHIKPVFNGDLPREDRHNAADDWAVLSIADSLDATAAASLHTVISDNDAGPFDIVGYPGGEQSFLRGIVVPSQSSQPLKSRSHSTGVLLLTGDGTRPGCSGGGVFTAEGKSFAGLHRARDEDTLQLHAVSATHIMRMLKDAGYECLADGLSQPSVTLAQNSGHRIDQVKDGLKALTGVLADRSDLRLKVAVCRTDIGSAIEAIQTVAVYKVMHDSLHNVEQRLDEVASGIERFKQNDPTAPLRLRRVALALKHECQRARAVAPKAPTANSELSWIDDLDRAIAQIERGSSPPGDDAALESTLQELALIIEESVRINALLCGFAANLRLESLIDALTEIHRQVTAAGAADEVTAKLLSGYAALRDLRAEFARRVAEHQEWQSLDTALTKSESSPEHEPVKRVPRWPSVRDRLTRLRDLFPNEAGYAELDAQRNRWELSLAESNAQMSLLEAQTFRDLASQLFFRVDGELNLLCGRLGEVSIPLRTLLEVLS